MLAVVGDDNDLSRCCFLSKFSLSMSTRIIVSTQCEWYPFTSEDTSLTLFWRFLFAIESCLRDTGSKGMKI